MRKLNKIVACLNWNTNVQHPPYRTPAGQYAEANNTGCAHNCCRACLPVRKKFKSHRNGITQCIMLAFAPCLSVGALALAPATQCSSWTPSSTSRALRASCVSRVATPCWWAWEAQGRPPSPALPPSSQVSWSCCSPQVLSFFPEHPAG